jgi:hypothetical protein
MTTMSRASDQVSRKRRRSTTESRPLHQAFVDHDHLTPRVAAPTISVQYNCLLLPAIILVWWYWTKRTTQHVFQRLLITAPTCTDPSVSCYDYFAHEEPSQEMTKTSTSPMPLDPFQRHQSPPISNLCCGTTAADVPVVQPADDDDDIRVMNPRQNAPFAQTAKRPFRWRRKPAREGKLPGSWAANLQYHLYAAASNQPFSSWSDVVQFNDQEYSSNPHLVRWITRHRAGDAADAIYSTTGQAATKLQHDEEAAKVPPPALPLEQNDMIVPTWSIQSPVSRNVEVQLAPSLESADTLGLDTDLRTANAPRAPHRASSENDLLYMWECIQDTTHVLGIEACI